MTFNFQGKVILITGSSSGIGQVTASHFAALQPAGVVITGRNTAGLEVTSELCQKEGLAKEKILIVPGDVASESDRINLVEATKQKFGRLDVLVNNAGIAPAGGDVMNCTAEMFDRIFAVNVKGAMILTQLCHPLLKASKGSVVNVSSVTAQRPSTAIGVYGMSKAAMDMMTKCMAIQLASDKIRVNAVNPTIIKTPLFSRSREGITEKNVEDMYTGVSPMHPLARVGESIEVARAIAFLASDHASFTTGETLLIDGGIAATFPILQTTEASGTKEVF